MCLNGDVPCVVVVMVVCAGPRTVPSGEDNVGMSKTRAALRVTSTGKQIASPTINPAVRSQPVFIQHLQGITAEVEEEARLWAIAHGNIPRVAAVPLAVDGAGEGGGSASGAAATATAARADAAASSVHGATAASDVGSRSGSKDGGRSGQSTVLGSTSGGGGVPDALNLTATIPDEADDFASTLLDGGGHVHKPKPVRAMQPGQRKEAVQRRGNARREKHTDREDVKRQLRCGVVAVGVPPGFGPCAVVGLWMGARLVGVPCGRVIMRGAVWGCVWCVCV